MFTAATIYVKIMGSNSVYCATSDRHVCFPATLCICISKANGGFSNPSRDERYLQYAMTVAGERRDGNAVGSAGAGTLSGKQLMTHRFAG
jgi:hypothetical protein